MKTIRPSLAAVLVGGPLLSFLVACGSSAGTTPQIASLPSHSVASTSPSQVSGSPVGGKSGNTGTDDGRPVFRLDDTDERRAALINAYNKCLLNHGAARASGQDVAPAGPGKEIGILVHQPVPAAATAACLHLLPLMPAELDAATNPDFHAQSLAYVDCLKGRGEWVRLLNNHNLDWTYVGGHPVPDNNAQIEDNCLHQAFGGK